jgi:hypothetical protein
MTRTDRADAHHHLDGQGDEDDVQDEAHLDAAPGDVLPALTELAPLHHLDAAAGELAPARGCR